ncbi:hypothetical protein L6Q21_09805 [Sandaracinobacter sp. RS1-74]|uniref:hypothetical protein n=1 Tax=Sandaracinobacteroides sayramensis TaxID=2913411 RepID=UPI001EDC5F31|nr:hypothetical protein [Sandaracinobacteroides sayramensis]MCG2841274.1 hypothetical protein [Sandaracinobacteroides sayramensis]
MTGTVRLTATDIGCLRRAAEQIARRHSGARRFAIEIAERVSLVSGESALNVWAISNDPDWADTDLHDKHSWRRIRERHVLAGGKALFDLYIYERRGIGEPGDLVCCAQAELDADGLLAVHADSLKNVWRRPAAD